MQYGITKQPKCYAAHEICLLLKLLQSLLVFHAITGWTALVTLL